MTYTRGVYYINLCENGTLIRENNKNIVKGTNKIFRILQNLWI